ncbi:monoacylglycerol lipase ABHD12 isoform X2 [Lingula anatina]|uniref:Monoacylglycerol lipase ABHD12 isoform X2 n=1 Tax=Lingula anatina TaxID=7574 RepID=A0A1S3IVC0_LINAN|nr:monoacylglycerol lipase ABHD12 isoform X2 [Lingula anatina]|eukprot:XP_013401901.1 monoacylglycerol lipase ABHD12 isoform X2 [Lingula anatina]
MQLRSGSKTKEKANMKKKSTKKLDTRNVSKKKREEDITCSQRSWSNKCLKTVGVMLFIIYVLIPVIVKTNSWIMSRVVFLPMFRPDMFKDVSKPEMYGLNSTRNFYIEDNGVKLGAWHVLPQSLAKEVGNEKQHITSLQDGKPIILYLHGQSGTRGSGHRIPLYAVLSSLELHVIAVDYRGYADSEGPFPCEPGLIRDGKAAYKWIKERSKNTPIFLWGHSLGAGVATQLAKELCSEGRAPKGMILESPFNNLREAASSHPLGLLWWFLPMFEWIFINPIEENDIHFQNDEQQFIAETSGQKANSGQSED